jgi:hypothetical protein
MKPLDLGQKKTTGVRRKKGKGEKWEGKTNNF